MNPISLHWHYLRQWLSPQWNNRRTWGTFRHWALMQCGHRSHRARLPCLRYWTYDAYCAKHNTTCLTTCPTEPKAAP